MRRSANGVISGACRRGVARPCGLLGIGFAAAITLGAGSVVADGARGDSSSATPPVPRQRELVRLLRQDCGSCHGMRLTGGLGPPLTPAALHGKPADSLTATIIGGRAGTAMPPWRPFMSEAEAAWLVTRLRQGDVDAP
jgi:cytochrome c55X